MLVECGRDLNWADINPDIFGSMIQAVVHPAKRSGMGMHYTSVVNIMKVIEPLFLTSLREEAVKSKDDPKKLDSLIQRLRSIRVFDPACGSGNFLIIAYKELRKLEIRYLSAPTGSQPAEVTTAITHDAWTVLWNRIRRLCT